MGRDDLGYAIKSLFCVPEPLIVAWDVYLGSFTPISLQSVLSTKLHHQDSCVLFC